MSLAKYFWKECPDRIGSALVASKMLKSLAHEARSAGKIHLADDLIDNAGFVKYYLLLRLLRSRPNYGTSLITLFSYSSRVTPL